MSIIFTNILLSFVFSIIGLVMTVIIHELGHLVGGLVTGYSFVYLQFLGIKISREKNRFTVKKGDLRPIGQCIMAPNSITQKPYALILGGIVSNMFMGIVFLIMSCNIFLGNSADEINKGNLLWASCCFSIAVINIILGIYNICGKNCELDGKTFKEVWWDKGSVCAYNRIMLINYQLINGGTWGNISEELFLVQSVRTSLVAELTLYSCMNEIEKITVYKDIGKHINSMVNKLNILVRCKYPFISIEAQKYVDFLNMKTKCSKCK